ncbi:MAG: tRNA (N(6)-L-threonylcarbamoyladenosine(37)-C(2))-methylthiotransferase MtaB [Butyrivibrio sp.]|nr:tRNA (N(6)-L-threonylcarbamoyladenosine(37)-C(2))-methylthiotransferase MtaB [Butyrivibrio sp.]
MKNVALHNLGCKVNGYELDVVTEKLRSRGFEIVPFDGPADVYVINTCTVTNIADRKTRQMLHRARKQNPEALIVAMGCYVDTHTAPTDAEADTESPLWDLAVDNAGKKTVVEQIEAALTGRAAARDEETFRLSAPPSHTRAYIKIQDGCNQFCSYCIIPYARGRIRSRLQPEIIEEVRGLVSQGIREVVLTGIHLSSYGRDQAAPHAGLDGSALLALIRELAEIPGLARIRLGSLEPRIITEDFVRGLAQIPAVCPHFHLSLQSGCDSVLQRMNRHYTTAEYAAGVALLRRIYDRPAITTDVIVGFPGETEEEFAQTVSFLEALALYEIHVFKFSSRAGTVAAGMEGQLTEAVKAARSDVLLALTAEQAAAYRATFAGEIVQVLWEEWREDAGGGRTLAGYTDRYVRVTIDEDAARSQGAAPGQLTEIKMK